MLLEYFSTGKRLHRFQAERMGDHTLNSSVSYIQKSYGLLFKRRRVDVPNRFGSTTSVCEYWLDEAGQELAKNLLPPNKKSAPDANQKQTLMMINQCQSIGCCHD